MQDPNHGQPAPESPKGQQEPPESSGQALEQGSPAKGQELDPQEKARRDLQAQRDRAMERLRQAEREKEFLLEQVQRSSQSNQSTATPERNPYDVNTQFQEWFLWNQQQLEQRLTARLEEASGKSFNKLLEQAAEMSWQQQHPDMDLAEVKRFASMRGISRLDDAYWLMNRENIEAGAEMRGRTSVTQQFANSQSAAPVQAGGGAGAQRLVFADDVAEWVKNPEAVEARWGPERTRIFHAELNARERAQLER